MFWNNNKNSPLYTIYKYNVPIYLNFWYSSIPGYSLKRVEKGIACMQATSLSKGMASSLISFLVWVFFYFFTQQWINFSKLGKLHNVKLSKTFHKNTAITWCDLHSISLNCQHLHLCMLLYFDLLIYDRLGTWRFTKSLTIPPLLKSCKIYTYLIKPLY